jgi:MoxR-like ATPase
MTTTHVPAAMDAPGFAADVDRLTTNLEYVIKGKSDVVRNVVVCLLAEGHLLIEDVPGTGKTSMARALAASINGSWQRIQFTPDLLPSDVTGVSIFDQRAQEFTFHPGAVFANVVVADEINRASPKTQSALLEVMEERTVSIDREMHVVPRPFMVVATQNPVEMDGTYRLPEAQLDRFLMRIEVGYPDADSELAILAGHHDGQAIARLRPVLSVERVQAMIAEAAQVQVSEALGRYIVALAAASRQLPEVRLGVSPRGSVALLRATRAAAAAAGRSYVLPEDVKALAGAVFGHRIIVEPEAELAGVRPADVVDRILRAVPVPQLHTGPVA